MVTAVAGGRAKSRMLAAALARRPAVLNDGRSPAPRAVGDLLIALRKAGAQATSPPVCAECGKHLRTLQRRGQDWYCGVCGPTTFEPCTGCGKTRRVSTRDRAGRPRCVRCRDIDGRDPLAVIRGVIAGLDPHADPDVVADVVRHSALRPANQQKIAWALEADPSLLTGNGHLAPFPVILRLIDRLIDAGVAGIVRPACPRCHRAVRISKPLDGQRVCRNCIAKSRVEECARCGTRRDPATRDDQGRPLCPNCLITDPTNLETCIVCGRRRLVNTRTPDGPICPTCRPLPTLVCSICGRTAPCTLSRLTDRPRCGACDQREARCTGCGSFRRVHSGTPQEPVCGPCTKPDAELWRPCPVCGQAERLRAPGPCRRCVLKHRLDELLVGPSGAVAPKLRALHEALASTERAATAIHWLSGGIVSTVLSDLGSGRRPLTHEALDELPDGKVVEHIRSVLVAAGALPSRDEQMIRLERVVSDLISSHSTAEGRQILHRYATWHLVRRLRHRTSGEDVTHEQLVVVRQHLRAAVILLGWLAEQGLTIATCRQADLERWLTSDDARLRQEAGHFVRWALARKIASDLSFPAVKWTGPSRPMDDEARWATARRLLHDDSIRTEDRLAGLLLLLYAQWPSAISRLTVDHIEETGGAVRIRLGDVPIDLPEPVADLALQQVAVRRSHAVLPRTASPWLFPGGQPGRPISAWAMGERLRKLGIRLAQTRSTALFQLATELPAAILARTLGIHITVAVKWQRAAAGDWGAYAAEVSRRNGS
ncbi:site-specific integrase [Streptomyces halobius]|uniref:Site-specific integrase n=1 Tax=Streptomyces halobius TaxID=2879846 RepID=A0ABY4MJX6_9ACTN|nr:site-specific integrase [Streptomyces halobius]UQA91114.1 site-specific integrase [Streptomyces halobius]UQA93740.1 site-specific integrase [Streptomyces halobius]UQA96631.1 site-specific integrase [Streptomyces halobius]